MRGAVRGARGRERQDGGPKGQGWAARRQARSRSSWHEQGAGDQGHSWAQGNNNIRINITQKETQHEYRKTSEWFKIKMPLTSVHFLNRKDARRSFIWANLSITRLSKSINP